MPSVFDVGLPSEYTRLMQPLHFFNLDLLEVFSVPGACIGDLAVRTAIQAGTPLAIGAAILALVLVAESVQTGQLHAGVQGGLLRALPFLTLLSFMVLPHVSWTVFGVFQCDSFAASPTQTRFFVHTDLAIECSDDDALYRRARGWAIFFMVVWPLGAPAVLATLLRKSREAVQRGQRTPISEALRFLHSDYRAPYFFFELVETGRKELLTGFVLLLPARLSMLRLMWALLLSIAYLVLLQAARPFNELSNHFFAVAVHTLLCFTFVLALLFKVSDEFVGEDAKERFFGLPNTVPLVVSIVGLNFAVLGLLGIQLGLQLRVDARLPTLRLKATRGAPELVLGAGERQHTFLSHVWRTAQDQVRVLKARLQQLLPQIVVWLDVDDLEVLNKKRTLYIYSLCTHAHTCNMLVHTYTRMCVHSGHRATRGSRHSDANAHHLPVARLLW